MPDRAGDRLRAALPARRRRQPRRVFDRPARRLAWWSPQPDLPAILSGRDLAGGGTWLGLTAEGRLAMLTNVRQAGSADPAAPSRGRIVTDWLAGREPTDRFWMRTALSGHNGFNLVAVDFRSGECFWASNRRAGPVQLGRGVHGLSNAGLDTPWPKVTALKARLRDAMAATVADGDPVDALANRLFDALGDRSTAADAELPDTGVPREVERRLSAAHIRPEARPDGRRYGTRCATLVITERARRQRMTPVFELGFDAGDDGDVPLRRVALADWPPRCAGGAAA